MKDYHGGIEDVSVVSPDAMIQTFDGVLQVLTLGVGGIAAISLLVAGILVMNLTLMSVRQRTAEIGLLKALGAPNGQVRAIFLAEAGTLACAGALAGLITGQLVVTLLSRLFPAIPFQVPAWALPWAVQPPVLPWARWLALSVRPWVVWSVLWQAGLQASPAFPFRSQKPRFPFRWWCSVGSPRCRCACRSFSVRR